VAYEKSYAVYLMTNRPRGVFYVGVTSDLAGRVWKHRNGTLDGFTKRYNLTRLAWFEVHSDIEAAIYREKQLKRWRREWKIALVEKDNPDWLDLWSRIDGSVDGPPLV
jgi:putative endonuclease